MDHVTSNVEKTKQVVRNLLVATSHSLITRHKPVVYGSHDANLHLKDYGMSLAI